MTYGAGIRRILVVAVALLLPTGAEAGGAPPSAFGPEAPLAELSGPHVGRLAIEPIHGPAGTPVAVTATGLPAGETFELVWRTSVGRWKAENGEYHGREYTPVGYEIAKVKADDSGGFVATFEAPEDFGFWHDVTLQQGDRLFTQVAFYVDMTVEVSPKSGPVGTPITVDIKGIGRQQLQNSWLLLYDNRYTGWISSVTTGGSAKFAIPATGQPGVHVLEVVHGDFTFPYRNMQQSPEPDRPQFALPFTITDGDPVLPPSPEDQLQTAVRRLPDQGDLIATPRFSKIGDPAVVTGAGLEPGKSYDLAWSTVTGNRVSGSGWEENSSVIATSTADGEGKVSFSFDVPDDLGGAHRIEINDGTVKRSGSYWIAPSAASLDIDSGPAGTTFKIHLKGVGWTETANIYTIVYDNSYIGYSCGFNSQGDVEIFLQATGEPGWHFIDLYPAIYKGKEGRPNNFRLPQLTYAEDHPGEDLPRFSFAFKVTPAERASR